MKNIIILGSTGSIGKSIINVLSFDKNKFNVLGMSANNNVIDLAINANKFQPKYLCISNEDNLEPLKKMLKYKPIIFAGRSGLLELSSIKCDLLINSLVGFTGLIPTINAIKAGSNIALANKETMVVAGEYINTLLQKHNVYLVPIDSEHNAVFQCLQGNKNRSFNKIILTASGGPFLNYPISKFNEISPEEALKHPTWGMGDKISIDSATMANKALEILEAIHLFKVDKKDITVLIHPQSIIHGMVEFKDASILALLGPTTMEIPIRYCLYYPEDIKSPSVKYLDFIKLQNLNFYKIDENRYPIMKTVNHVAKELGILPCVFNASNEVAVAEFLKRNISFDKIYYVIEKTLSLFDNKNKFSIDDIVNIDGEVRIKAKELISGGRL